MHKIGIVTLEKEQGLTIHQLLNENNYTAVEVVEKTQIKELDGIILDVGKDNCFSQVCEWLIHCQIAPQVFVWIILPTINVREINMYLHLGMNGCILAENVVEEIPLVIKNTFSRISSEQYTEEKKKNEAIILNDTNMCAVIDGRHEIPLTRSEYQILQILYRQKGSTVSYQTIYETLWNRPANNDLYRVANLIFHLRKKLGTKGEQCIQTVRTKGYRLVG
ncbi:two-component system, OmpR family, lantibiotic biosynthesis response regulator NisR/SpaR [Enterococcus sp. DIV0724b]|uniref:helix-turn-helix domain-containing protein n=1 Tax=Enterococcus sp. DIV0724b TaxID=2774694 RepID=UPI003D2FABF7